MTPADLPERFAKRIAIDPGSGCWRWTGRSRAGKGYPYAHWHGGMAYVHRIVYHLLVDQTMPVRGAGHTHCIDHVAERCAHRPDCVNPAHLELVPWAENVRRHFRLHPEQNQRTWDRRRAAAQQETAA